MFGAEYGKRQRHEGAAQWQQPIPGEGQGAPDADQTKEEEEDSAELQPEKVTPIIP